jgi:hypothetical protein
MYLESLSHLQDVICIGHNLDGISPISVLYDKHFNSDDSLIQPEIDSPTHPVDHICNYVAGVRHFRSDMGST